MQVKDLTELNLKDLWREIMGMRSIGETIETGDYPCSQKAAGEPDGERALGVPTRGTLSARFIGIKGFWSISEYANIRDYQ